MGIFLVSLVLLVGLAAAVSQAPLAVAVTSVALFAGPHNWMEIRYLLGRLPNRTGKLRQYFLTSSVGVLLLGLGSLAVLWLNSALTLSLWNSALVLWVGYLLRLRSRENPPRNWWWLEPVLLFLLGWVWYSPYSFSLTLILGHPLLALVILERELHAFRRPELKLYRALLASIPVGLTVLWFLLSRESAVSQLNNLQGSRVTSTWLLGTHTYLELLHYGVWIFALPLLGVVTKRDKLEVYPFLKKAPQRLKAVRWILTCGILLGVALWLGFYLDFERTRDLYFELAIFHVLIEFPFLVRLI